MESNIIRFPVKNDYCVQSEPKTDTWADPHEKHAKEWAMYNLYMKIADNNLMKGDYDKSMEYYIKATFAIREI